MPQETGKPLLILQRKQTLPKAAYTVKKKIKSTTIEQTKSQTKTSLPHERQARIAKYNKIIES